MNPEEVSTGPANPLSERLRDETADVHDAAEHSPFVTRLLEGALPLDAYVLLLAQYRPVYRALETVAARYRHDPVVGPFVPEALDRSAALARDLGVLGGDRVDDIAVTAATADWAGGFVAHHYVRYLGDLSGGQIIRRILGRHYGLTDDRGLSFYVFDGLDNGVQFKKQYRASLDATPWTGAEQDRIVAEARLGFAYNLAVFTSLEEAASALAGAAEI